MKTLNLATMIKVVAKPGKEEALAELLTGAGALVKETEPETLLWMGLRDENKPNTFYIVDFFAAQSGREAHFAGKVAAALKGVSEELVEGGWEQGVVANISNANVLSTAE